MFGFLSRKKKEVQPDKVKKPAERENPATIPSVGEQDLDGLIKRIGISSQGKDNGSITARNVTERISPSGPPGGGKEVPEQQMGVAVPEWSEPGTSKGQSAPPSRSRILFSWKKKRSPPCCSTTIVQAGKKVAPTQKGEPEKDESVSVDDIDGISGLILPKGATFKVEEIRLTDRSEIFKLKGIGIDVPGKDLQKSDLLDSSLKSVTAVASEVQAEAGGTAGLLKKLNPMSVIHKVPVEYSARTHGPLVDLTFRPRPGVEQIELYPVNEPYAYVRITYDNATHEYTYEVLEPKLTPAEADLFKDIKERIFERLDLNTQNVMEEIAKKMLRDVTDDIIRDYGISLTPVQREKILYAMYKEFLGNGMIDPLMHDKYIEDISCDGINANLFVFHTRYESMRTNLMYRSAEELDSFVIKLAQRSGKYISIAEPMLDAAMSDGSRIQMTLGSEVTAHGSTYTIRKFKDEPITPTDLIEWRTFSPLAIAFFWLAVESGKSCIFAGGTASGKTTTLNAISLFIPPLAKIVTLEDTRELKLPHSNWIPSVTRTSFDTEGKGEIDMYELLRAALRQRPEYILVGEVRGEEALSLSRR